MSTLMAVPCGIRCPHCDLLLLIHSYGYRAMCPQCHKPFDIVAVPLNTEGPRAGGNKGEIKGLSTAREPPAREDGGSGGGNKGEIKGLSTAQEPPPEDEGARINSAAKCAAARAQDDGHPASTIVP